MLGLNMLDVAIGLVFIYLVLALACTAATEAFSGFFDCRTKHLEQGLHNLLGNSKLVDELFQHPLIKALREDDTKPSYIPAPVFASALMDMIAPATERPPVTDGHLSAADHFRKMAAERGKEYPELYRTLALMLNETGNDLTMVKPQIEAWFNAGTERISAWYKQKAHRFVVVFAFIITVIANVDTFDLAQQLYRQPAVRDALVNAARTTADSVPADGANSAAKSGEEKAPLPSIGTKDATDKLQTLGLKLGWEKNAGDAFSPVPSTFFGWATKIIGLLVTALAVSLGAPFWFDMLNKIMSVRGVGKSPDEKKAKVESGG